MRCRACGYCVDLRVENKRFWCRKLGMYVYPCNNGHGPEQMPDGADCHWFTLVLTEDEQENTPDIFP